MWKLFGEERVCLFEKDHERNISTDDPGHGGISFFCLRNINLAAGNHGLPELICVGVAMLLHNWKRNTLLSIGVSTLLYMLLVQCGA